MKSKIFTIAELKALNKLIKGNKYDPTGIISTRVKPKIREIEYWKDRWADLSKIIKKGKK